MNEWTKIEDGLPDDHATVLVVEYGRIELQRNCYPPYLTKSRGITHWMYAPALPSDVPPRSGSHG